MKYINDIHENKAFSFFKQLIYNIALSICILLLLAIVCVYGFKFQLYGVLSDSQAPIFTEHDLMVAKAQDEYYVGDIIKFTDSGINVTHRLVFKVEDTDGKTWYICHGDNAPSCNPYHTGGKTNWEEERDFLSGLTTDQIMGRTGIEKDSTQKMLVNVQRVEKKDIQGKYLFHFKNYALYFNFIKEHALLFITIVVGIWCINNVIQNEIDMKIARRFEN